MVLAERREFELLVALPYEGGSFPAAAIVLDILAQCSDGTLLNKSYPRNQTRRPVKDLAAFDFMAAARRTVSSWTKQ